MNLKYHCSYLVSPKRYRITACFVMGTILISCATADVIQQKYLDTSSLSRIQNVAVTATINPPEVINSRTDSNPLVFYMFFGLLGAAIESDVRTKRDEKQAETVAENTNLVSCQNKFAQSFINKIEESQRFKTINYLKDSTIEDQNLIAKRYQAIIRLSVKKIVLSRVSHEEFTLSVTVLGQMIDLGSSNVLWNREDCLISPEKHPIGYYEKDGLEELNYILERAGNKLGFDFVYLD